MTDLNRRVQKHLYQADSQRAAGAIEVDIQVDTNHRDFDEGALELINAVQAAVTETLDEPVLARNEVE